MTNPTDQPDEKSHSTGDTMDASDDRSVAVESTLSEIRAFTIVHPLISALHQIEFAHTPEHIANMREEIRNVFIAIATALDDHAIPKIASSQTNSTVYGNMNICDANEGYTDHSNIPEGSMSIVDITGWTPELKAEVILGLATDSEIPGLNTGSVDPYEVQSEPSVPRVLLAMAKIVIEETVRDVGVRPEDKSTGPIPTSFRPTDVATLLKTISESDVKGDAGHQPLESLFGDWPVMHELLEL